MSSSEHNRVSPIAFLIGLLLFLILYLPTLVQPLKLVVLVILFLFILFSGKLTQKFIYSKRILIWLLVYITANLIFLGEGILTNSTLLVKLAPLYLVWPLLYTITLISGFSLKRIRFNYVTFFTVLAIIIPIFIIVTFINYTNGINNSVVNIIFPTVTSDYGGFINYFSPSITSLFFLGTWSLCVAIVERKLKIRILALLGVVLIITSAILIGRRALLITVVLGPVIFLILDVILFKRWKRVSQLLFLTFVIVIVISVVLNIFSSQNLRIFNLDSTVVQNKYRSLQFVSLMDGWKEHPLLGSGFGINASVIRSQTTPGAYELSYIALLFQTGLLGGIIYLALYLWIFISLNSIYMQTNNIYYLIVNVGYVSIMIVNATNPYINSFDGLWIIFFCLALINRFDIYGEEIYEK